MKILHSTSGEHFCKAMAQHVVFNVVTRTITTFRTGEILCVIDHQLEGEIIVVGSIVTHQDLLETLVIIDAAYKAGAQKVILVAPYVFYSRQDTMQAPSSSVGIEIIAKLLKASGVSTLVTVDIHSSDSLKFFDFEVKHITLADIMSYYHHNFPHDLTIIAPDEGSAKRLLSTQKNIVTIKKIRTHDTISMSLTGDIKGKNCLIIDDIFDSGSTMLEATKLLKNHGALNVCGYVTHFLGDSVPSALPLYTTNSIPKELAIGFVQIFSLAPLVAKSLQKVAI
jgi:ribose-phosphate pyrophosphokinase